MKRLALLSLIIFNGMSHASAPLTRSYIDEFAPIESKLIEAGSARFVPYSSQEHELRNMRGYPHPAGYDTSDPLNSSRPSAQDIADRMKRSQSDLLP